MTYGFSTGFYKAIRWIGRLLALAAIGLFCFSKGAPGAKGYPEYAYPALMLFLAGITVLSLRSKAEKRAMQEKRLRKYQLRVARLGETGVRKAYRRAIKIAIACFALALCIMFLESMFMVWPLGIAAVGFLFYAGTLEKPANS